MTADLVDATCLLDGRVSRLLKALVKYDFSFIPTHLQAAFNFQEPVTA